MPGQVEAERKYALADDQELPALDALAAPGQVHEFTLIATYYDSPDLRLNRARVTLRRRTGGHDDGWHLKLPGGGADERIEVHAPLRTSAGRLVPAELWSRVAEHLDGAPLVPVVVLHTQRREQELLGPDGTVVALTCTDDVRAEVGDRVESWREAEVELSGGGMTLLDAVEAQLSAAGIHRALIGSKAGRALAARADRQAPGSASTAADLVLSYLAVQVGVLQRFGTGLDSDSEAVHDARVATRRLRSTLRTYADLFEGSSLGKVNSRLRALTRVLGPARDSEVVLARLTTALVDLLGVAADSALARLVVDPLEARREELRKQLKDYVASPAHAGLQKALMALLAVPRLRPVASGPAVEVLPGGRSAMVAAVLRTSDGASVGATSLATWHEIRKEAKVVRYATELLLPAIPALAAQKAAWELVTESLGAAQDIVVASRTLSELALGAATDGGAGDVLDDLRHRLEERLPAALAQGRDALATALAGE